MENFLEASKRHYNDAMFLWGDNRFPNAIQLHGFAAECGLKALIVRYHGSNTSGIPSKYKEHADVLVPLLKALRMSVGERKGAAYFNMLSKFKAFQFWRIDHRYWSDSTLGQHLAQYGDGYRGASEG